MPAIRHIVPFAVAATIKSRARPWYFSFIAQPSNIPFPRISEKTWYLALMRSRCSRNNASLAFTPASISGVLIISSARSAMAQANGLPP